MNLCMEGYVDNWEQLQCPLTKLSYRKVVLRSPSTLADSCVLELLDDTTDGTVWLLYMYRDSLMTSSESWELENRFMLLYSYSGSTQQDSH